MNPYVVVKVISAWALRFGFCFADNYITGDVKFEIHWHLLSNERRFQDAYCKLQLDYNSGYLGLLHQCHAIFFRRKSVTQVLQLDGSAVINH